MVVSLTHSSGSSILFIKHSSCTSPISISSTITQTLSLSWKPYGECVTSLILRLLIPRVRSIPVGRITSSRVIMTVDVL